MTEEADSEEQVPTEKLLIDDPSDFQFHAAYTSYSDAYDNSNDEDIRRQLNENIKALKDNQIGFQDFYKNISRFRETKPGQSYGRSHIRTQRKREWRRVSERRERNKRHKK